MHRTVRKSGYANLSIPFSLACLSVRGLPLARLIKYCGHPGGSLLPAAEKRSSPSPLLFLEQDVCYIIGWRVYAFLLLRTKQQTTTRIMKTPELTIWVDLQQPATCCFLPVGAYVQRSEGFRFSFSGLYRSVTGTVCLLWQLLPG